MGPKIWARPRPRARPGPTRASFIFGPGPEILDPARPEVGRPDPGAGQARTRIRALHNFGLVTDADV